ncbi:HAD family hydrolase [Sandaracinus amylolyticus]|uniref:phosphoglycolate phosphatase n=1 Tax=Sandaracinus amylolyticus TaxID=927083 RepID=A0A0F6W7C3_9BACT|nr:HAD family hydrolase [Sandaracinus amylolyticus]AKF09350.1 hydrolase, haloacid dehalogenase-like family [Sandaracinus amylolyticus]
MRPTIALFDIDGTLVSCGGAGRRSMERAFVEIGARTEHAGFDFGGMTDRAIARQGLRNAGLDDHDAAIDALIERYLSHLAGEVTRSEGYRVLPGVVEMLERLRALGAIAIGLGTGNVEAGARVKLTRGALHDRFDFGGFGSDAEDRAQLLAIGADRGAARLGRARSECRVVVIGDTPRDVSAAIAIGAECLAVGTGAHAADALARVGAHVAVDDLRDVRAWEMVTGG